MAGAWNPRFSQFCSVCWRPSPALAHTGSVAADLSAASRIRCSGRTMSRRWWRSGCGARFSGAPAILHSAGRVSAGDGARAACSASSACRCPASRSASRVGGGARHDGGAGGAAAAVGRRRHRRRLCDLPRPCPRRRIAARRRRARLFGRLRHRHRPAASCGIAFGLLARWPAGRIAVRAAGGAIAIAGLMFLGGAAAMTGVRAAGLAASAVRARRMRWLQSLALAFLIGQQRCGHRTRGDRLCRRGNARARRDRAGLCTALADEGIAGWPRPSRHCWWRWRGRCRVGCGALLAAAIGFCARRSTRRPRRSRSREANLTLARHRVGATVVLTGACCELASRLTRDWQRIGARILGSWIAASAILVLALRLCR